MILNKGYDPLKVPGLVAFFDPDTLSGADGTAVASWSGRLNPNNVVSQGTGSQQPTLATHASGRRLLSFASASSQTLIGTVTGLPQRAPLTVVTVSQPTTVTGFQSLVEYTSGAASTGWSVGQNAANNTFTAYSKKEYDTGTATANGFQILTTEFATDFSCFTEKNNGQVATPISGTADIVGTCNTLQFGAHLAAASTPYNGKLGMVLIFNRLLSRTERCDLYRWLQDAYKIPNGDLGLYHGTMLSLPSADVNHSADHPDVVYIPGGFGPDGHPYWMAMTPYPGGSPGDASQENPTIISSADGLTWVNPTGLGSIPIDPAPGVGFNSDTDLVYQGGALHMFYREYAQGTGAGSEKIYYQTSTDGVTWTPSAPGQVVLTSAGITSANGLPSAAINDARLVAPTVIYDTSGGTYNGKWRMWTVRVTSSNAPQVAAVDHWTATSPTGTWTHDTVSTMDIPTSDTRTGVNNGWDVWHIDVEWCAPLGLFVCLINDKRHLLWATSQDGITWKVASKAFLSPSVAQNVAGAPPWDGTQLYRSVFRLLPSATEFEVWYAGIGGASSASANNWHVGYVKVPISELYA